MQFKVRRFHFHGIQSAFSQSQIGYAHKQKNVRAFLKLVLLLLIKLLVRGTQLILIDCYLPEKRTGPHNYAHLVLTVLTKGANSDLKIASAIILN